MEEIRIEGRDYVVKIEGDKIFIGTPGLFSNLAAQMMSHKVMESLRWEPTKTFMDLKCNGNYCTAAGYIIPYFIRLFYNPIEYIKTSIQSMK